MPVGKFAIPFGHPVDHDIIEKQGGTKAKQNGRDHVVLFGFFAKIDILSGYIWILKLLFEMLKS